MSDWDPDDDGALIRVWLVSPPADLRLERLRLPGHRPHEPTGFDVVSSPDDHDLLAQLAAHRPHVIVSFGSLGAHAELHAASLQVRRRWLHEPGEPDEAALAERILATFLANATQDRFPDQPLVSVVTPTYRTGAALLDAYASLCGQTYPGWEWVVVDDSDDDGTTFGVLTDLARRDPRVRAHRGTGRDGSIGSVKRSACGLADGALVVELDHDDRLLPRCLERVVQAAATYPEAGFFYSDAADVDDDGEPLSFGDDWAFGFGGYRREEVEGRELLVQCYPPINAKTIRHITGAPNHVRAWRSEAYWACGGHRRELMVADDYDLCVRMFLSTRMVHIPECSYVQVHHRGTGGSGNAQRRRRGEIQRLVRALAAHHEPAIHARFVELGVDDFIWTGPGQLDWTRSGPPDGAPANLVLDLGAAAPSAPPDVAPGGGSG